MLSATARKNPATQLPAQTKQTAMWRREVTMPVRDMFHSLNDITWQDSDNGASWHKAKLNEHAKSPFYLRRFEKQNKTNKQTNKKNVC